MQNVYLTGSVRTPIGRFGGSLASLTAADLGVAAAKESLRRASLRPEQIQQSIWGCARQAGGGPNVARQITYRAGVPETGAGVHGQPGVRLRIAGDHPGGAADHGGPRGHGARRWGGEHVARSLLRGRRADGECGWETRNSLTACIVMVSTIRCQDLVMGETAENLARQYDNHARRAGRVRAAFATTRGSRDKLRAVRRGKGSSRNRGPQR